MDRHSDHRAGPRLRLGAVTALVSGLLVFVTAAGTVQAAAFDSIPDRLYMVPAGGNTDLPGDIPGVVTTALAGLKVGELEFDGSDDLIVNEAREIVVTATEGPNGCDLQDETQASGETDYDIDDCTRLRLTTSLGRIRFDDDAVTAYRDHLSGDDVGQDNPADWLWLLPDGAVIDAWGGGDPGTDSTGGTDPGDPNDDDGYANLELNGDTAMLNAALASLVYIPPADYHYTGESPSAGIEVALTGGDGASPPSPHRIDIRVLSVNQFPTHDGPTTFAAAAATEELITGFTVEDEDNDEDVDADQPDELPDGANDEMLLIGFLDCGQAPILDTGFHFDSATFAPVVGTLADFLEQRLDPTGAGAFIAPVLAALEAIAPGLADLEIQTSGPTEWTTLFAGVATMAEVRAALTEITFRHDTPEDTCELITIVSDLGNNGLPVQWIADPAPAGTEIPMIGFDWNVLAITTGALQEIDVTFDAETIVFDEAAAPDTVSADLHISPSTHPQFTIVWEAFPTINDVVGPGEATPQVDFQGTFNNTLVIPQDAEIVSIADQSLNPPNTNVFPDALVEGDETFQFRLVLDEPPPDGWAITSSVPTRTVMIADDDDPPKQILPVADVSVVEGDAGTTTMTFTVELSAPADGDESFDVTTVDGTAEAPADYTAIAGDTYTFSPGATTVDVDVTIAGDLLEESDPHDFTLQLSNPQNVGLPADVVAIGSIDDDDQPSMLSIADTSILEGNVGPLTVSMTNPVGRTCSVTITTADGIATAPADFAALAAAPLSLVGVASAAVDLSTVTDADVEGDHALTASIALAAGSDARCQLADDTATVTITETPIDPDISASIDDVTGTEGHTGDTTNLEFTVTLTEPAVGGESVDYATVDGTATAGTDHTATSGTITFNEGATSATVMVSVIGDRQVEADEQFTVELTTPAGITVADASATGTITNDDQPSTLSIADTAVLEGATGVLTVSMTNPTEHTCAVEVTTTDGTAIASDDYAALVAAPVVVDDAASATTDLTTLADADPEIDEILTVEIALSAASSTDPNCQLGDAEATVTITETAVPAASVGDTAIVEGDTGTANAVFTITLVGPVAAGSETVDYATTDGTATAGIDYTSTSGTATFAAGATTFEVIVPIVGEYAVEADEMLTLSLSNPSGLTIVDASATGTITNDDDPSVLDIADRSIVEGDLDQLMISMTELTGHTCTVEVTTTDGTASAPGDYTALSAVPVTLAGVASNTIDLATISDLAPEGAETLAVGIVLAAGTSADCVLGDATATITIDDTPTPIAAQANDVTVTEGNSATTNLVFVITLATPAVTGGETVDFATSNGTATAGVDYAATSGTATFAVGATTFPVAVAVTGDTAVESNETLLLTLSNPVGVTIADAMATGTIANDDVDDDPPPDPLVVDVPDDITQPNDPGQPGAVVTWPAATSTGGTPPVEVACTHDSGDFFPIGSTTVTCTATDSAPPDALTIGRSVLALGSDAVSTLTTDATFTVTILDVEPPTIADPADLVRSTTGDPIAVTFPLPVASDNSGLAPVVTCSRLSGSTFSVGAATVTCTATDDAGNEASSAFLVTVVVQAAPPPPPPPPPSGQLPQTGGTPSLLLLIGAGLVTLGLLLRPRRHPQQPEIRWKTRTSRTNPTEIR